MTLALFNWFRHSPTEYIGEIFSPNHNLKCLFFLRNGKISYQLEKGQKILVKESNLGLSIAGEAPLDKSLSLIRTQRHSFDETWEPIYGETQSIRNHYNETTFYLAEKNGAKRLLVLRFRLFDDGLGFRYEIPVQPKFQQITITDELTEFNINPNSYAWSIPAYQPDRYEYNYERKPIYELKNSVHTPLTIEDTSGSFLSLHEAALYNYGSMTLKLDEKIRLKSDITPLSDGTRAHVLLPFNSPWRVIMVGDSELDLLSNKIVLNLNDPPKSDFSWVHPLKFMGIWWAMFVGEWTWAPGERHGATTEHAIAYLDACKRLNIDGLLIEGWNNGWEGNWLLAGADSNFTKPMPDFDLPKVTDYAHQLGVELIGHHETVGFVDNYEAQIEAAYQYYSDHGIKYIKPGYSGSMMTINGKKEFHHSQIGVKHYQKALELAAKYHIMLDVHEPIKGTGIERTWPNILTREGARGQEYEGGALSPSHVCIIPFTRLLAGGMDYTSGIFDVTNNVKRLASTLTRQLAYYIIIYSGMQMAADRPVFYEEKYPDLFRFIQAVPLSFSQTVPLAGHIGQYLVLARKDRTSDNWFIGGVTNEEARTIHIQFDFLPPHSSYSAELFLDSPDAHYRGNQLGYEITQKIINSSDYLDIFMAAGGGFAIILKPLS